MLRDVASGVALAAITGVFYALVMYFGPLNWKLGDDACDLLVLVGIMLSAIGFFAEYLGSRLNRRLREDMAEIDERSRRFDESIRARVLRLNAYVLAQFGCTAATDAAKVASETAKVTVHTILPRGIRNNNPLNIRLVPDNRWQGRVPPKHNSDGAFEQFQDPIMGLRAAAVLLIAHYDRRHLDTIRKLVQVWAPPNENDTEAYAQHVARASRFGIDDPLDLYDHSCLRPILTAMIRVENGRQPYTDAQIDAALVRAGVMPPQRSLQQTRTVKGGQVAAASTIGAGTIGAIQETIG